MCIRDSVEGRGLEHFGERQLHLVGERRQMARGNLMISVLDQMQVLDQQIAPPRPVAEQQFDLLRGGRIDLASFRSRFGAFSSLAGMFERADLLHIMTHWEDVYKRQENNYGEPPSGWASVGYACNTKNPKGNCTPFVPNSISQDFSWILGLMPF